ncbi:MAG: apocytochrome f [Spirulina sp. SIO3F2]|nr:apocytochrome f [Spirulina sp. SIO3F2]
MVAIAAFVFNPSTANAYPFWAQQTAPETPREATGRIVCANCHLAQKPAEVKLPMAVTPDTVFAAEVEIPYDLESQQVLGDGSKGGLNVGAVLMLPEGFKIAPEDRLTDELKEETEGLFYQSYADGQDNVVIIGPISGEDHQKIVFPVLSPDPATDKNINFGKYLIHLGANRGRGQVYPTGDKSNNNQFTASATGVISDVNIGDYQSEVTITTDDGATVVETIPAGPTVLVSAGQEIAAGDALTDNPNVGGFGQEDAEIVLQNPARIGWLMVFFVGIAMSQAFLVLKKKQIERVQAAEMNF